MIKHLFYFVFIQLAKHAPAVFVIPVFIPMYSSLGNSLWVFYLNHYKNVPKYLALAINYHRLQRLCLFCGRWVCLRQGKSLLSLCSQMWRQTFLSLLQRLSRFFVWMFIFMLNVINWHFWCVVVILLHFNMSSMFLLAIDHNLILNFAPVI